MSGPQRTAGASDELGLAEVAWQLRTTLATAGEVSVHGDDAVLRAIRRRSTQRRRAKRVVGTSMAAFVLSFTTLLVVRGGQAAINHDTNRNAESPALTVGATGVPGGGGDESDGTTVGTDPDSSEVATDRCAGGDHRSCSTSTSSAGATTVTGHDHASTGDGPDNSKAPATTGSGPVTTVEPTTRPPVTTPTTRSTYTWCPEIRPGAVPADTACLARAFANGQAYRLVVVTLDEANVETRRLFSVTTTGIINVETSGPGGTAGHQQCTQLSQVGAPDWYAVSGCTAIPTG